MTVAYSYLRFSSPQQATGDSIRRQVEKTGDWCRRHKVQLDTSVTLRDEGVSAFRGKHRENPDTHALASFLQAVRSGRVQAGSYLVVESLDRLSREKIRPALTLLLNLIEAGVKVVQLLPVEATYDEDVEPMALLQAIMELNRGHSESKVKSERVGAAWARKRREAATRIVTRRLPGWVRYDNGHLVLDKDAAATVRRVFQLARDGLGVRGIAEALNREGVQVLGRKMFKGRPVVWSETVVYYLLTSRAVIGEYQPHQGRGGRRTRKAAGEAVQGYYPAVIDAALFYAVQAALKQRAKASMGGRRGSHVNLFSGMLMDARDGGSLTYKHHRTRPAILIPVGAKHGRGVAWASFPAAVFEEQVLRRLHEIKARDLWPNGDAVHKVESLAGQVAEVEGLIKVWTAKMDNPDTVDIVAAKLAEYRTRQRELTEQLAAAQREASSPASETWGEMRSLVEVLREAPDQDEVRQRLRAALRRVIEGVYCLFAGRGSVRVAAVEVWFTNGKRRCFFLGHEQPRVNRPGRPWTFAFNGTWDMDTGHAHSLRDPKTVRKVLARLDTVDLPAAESLADAVGDTSTQVWLATDNHAAWLNYVEQEASRPDDDENKLPPHGIARLRAIAAIPFHLGWPVFKG